MKKHLSLLTFLVISLIIPFNAFAKDGTPLKTNLEEAVISEGMTFDHPGYTSDDTKAKIYIFRGRGCSFCKKLLTYLNSIVDENGKYFDVITYEVWYDADNANLMKTVASVLGDEVTGVPYMIIGDKSFKGYTSTYDDDILKAIKNLYNSKDRYDVMDHLDEATIDDDTGSSDTSSGSKTTRSYSLSNANTNSIIIYVSLIATVAICAIYIVKSNNDTKIINAKLENIEKELKNMKTKTDTKTINKTNSKTKKKN